MNELTSKTVKAVERFFPWGDMEEDETGGWVLYDDFIQGCADAREAAEAERDALAEKLAKAVEALRQSLDSLKFSAAELEAQARIPEEDTDMLQSRVSLVHATLAAIQETPMTDTTHEAPEMLPCPFCGGGNTTIEGKGQIFRGVKLYSDPQWYQLTHFGKLSATDNFPRCSVEFVCTTEAQAIEAWNTRAALEST